MDKKLTTFRWIILPVASVGIMFLILYLYVLLFNSLQGRGMSLSSLALLRIPFDITACIGAVCTSYYVAPSNKKAAAIITGCIITILSLIHIVRVILTEYTDENSIYLGGAADFIYDSIHIISSMATAFIILKRAK